MTTMIIDNKARTCKPYEKFIIDRKIYKRLDELKWLANECMNSDVYKITIYEDYKELFVLYNE